MSSFSCPRPFYEDPNDKQHFIEGYIKWKQGEFDCKHIFTTSIIKEDIPSSSGEPHEFLRLEPMITIIFNKLDKPNKKNMAEVCKCWAAWFLVGTETSKVDHDYDQQLVRQNYEGMVTLSRKGRVVQRFCKCRYFRTEKEKYDYHRQLAKQQLAKDKDVVYQSEASGSEGYYDSDC